MEAEIKYFHSPDIFDLDDYTPKTLDSFGFLLQVMIGVKGMDGEESFDMIVCTPEWLKVQMSCNDLILGLHYVFVKEYDFNRIKQKIEDYVRGINGENWNEIAQKLSFLGKWEFEDYKP